MQVCESAGMKAWVWDRIVREKSGIVPPGRVCRFVSLFFRYYFIEKCFSTIWKTVVQLLSLFYRIASVIMKCGNLICLFYFHRRNMALRATRDQLSPCSSPPRNGRGVFHCNNDATLGTVFCKPWRRQQWQWRHKQNIPGPRKVHSQQTTTRWTSGPSSSPRCTMRPIQYSTVQL